MRGDEREYLWGWCNDFDAKMWVSLVRGEIMIFGGQDVKIFDRIIVGDSG